MRSDRYHLAARNYEFNLDDGYADRCASCRHFRYTPPLKRRHVPYDCHLLHIAIADASRSRCPEHAPEDPPTEAEIDALFPAPQPD